MTTLPGAKRLYSSLHQVTEASVASNFPAMADKNDPLAAR